MFARLMGLKTMSLEAVRGRAQDGDRLYVIDVNSRESWMKARLPGASNASPVDFSEADLPADKAATLVFYCSNMLCRKAPNAARRAEKMSYTNVHVMSAGISGWMGAGLATEAGAPGETGRG